MVSDDNAEGSDSEDEPHKVRVGSTYCEVLEDAKAKIKESTDAKHRTMSQSKNRAQVISASAVSLVNVALLRQALAKNNNSEFFIMEVTLISICLGLMFIAGILSILIAHGQDYMSKHGISLCGELRQNCCICGCPPQTSDNADKNDDDDEEYNTTTSSPHKETKPPMGAMGAPEWIPSMNSKETQIPIYNMDEDPCICCNSACTTELYCTEEYLILKQYHKWRVTSTDNQLMIIRAKEEIEFYARVMKDSCEHLTFLRKTIDEVEDATDKKYLSDKMVQLTTDLDNAIHEKKLWRTRLNEAEVYSKQGGVLKDWAAAILKDKAARLVEHWQNVLNYIMYVITTLNSVIAGFTFSK